jgi:hypothetical protein
MKLNLNMQNIKIENVSFLSGTKKIHLKWAIIEIN